MNKQELKAIIKDMRDFVTSGELQDDKLHIITDTYEHYFISEFDELPPKISINNITVAIFLGGYSRGLYLKNGLKSFRKAREHKLT
jgi:hypothetical protein